MAVAKNTALFKEAKQHQYAQQRTPEAKQKLGLWLLGIGVGVIVVSYFIPWLPFLFPVIGWGGAFLGYLLSGHGGAWVGVATILIVKVICVVMAIWGIATLVSAVRTPVKVVKCLFCSNSFRVFHKVKKTFCLNCGQLALLGDGLTSPDMTVATCGYCGLQTAVAKDIREFPCSNCAIQLSATGTPVSATSNECPSCRKQIPGNAWFCKGCGTALRPPYTGELFTKDFDMDWLFGKDALGCWQFASYILNSLLQRVDGIQELHSFATPFTELKMAVLCSENALALQGTNIKAETVLPLLDRTYAALLKRALQFVQTEPDKKYEKGSLKCFTSPPYAAARKSFETNFSTLIPADSRWAQQLLVVERTKFDLIEKHRIVNYSALTKDAGRLVAFASVAR
jgi:hypothetical protein